MRYLTGMLPPWWYMVWLSLTSVPLFKGDGAVRPVGVEPNLVRAVHKKTNRVNKPVLADYLEPQQFA